MIRGDVPMRLSRRDVWRLVCDRFSAEEVAYLAGVSVPVARGMIFEATPGNAKRAAFPVKQNEQPGGPDA